MMALFSGWNKGHELYNLRDGDDGYAMQQLRITSLPA